MTPDQFDLRERPISEQCFADDPDPHMLVTRLRHPWLARSEFGLVVTDYQACVDILGLAAKLKTPAAQIRTCRGRFPARLQIAEALHLLAQRIQWPRRVDPAVWRLLPGVWGPKNLPITFDAVAHIAA